jgi:hypothetical protein
MGSGRERVQGDGPAVRQGAHADRAHCARRDGSARVTSGYQEIAPRLFDRLAFDRDLGDAGGGIDGRAVPHLADADRDSAKRGIRVLTLKGTSGSREHQPQAFAIGIETGWRMIQGTQDFFTCTKKHAAGIDNRPLIRRKGGHEQVLFENATRLHLEGRGAIVIHGPQPLPLVRHKASALVPIIVGLRAALRGATGLALVPDCQVYTLGVDGHISPD